MTLADTATANSNVVDTSIHTRTAPPDLTQEATQWWPQKLLDPWEEEGNQLGFNVALDGDTVMFGAPQTMIDGEYGRGAVHVFERELGVWHHRQSLTAIDGGAGDWYGGTIALHGDMAVITANHKVIQGIWGAGAAYVYTRSTEGWTLDQVLTAPQAIFNHKFGMSVDLDDQTLLVSSHNDHIVYVYERDGGPWTLTETLEPPPGVAGQFGLTVSLDGNRVAVGAPTSDEGAPLSHGSTWVFDRVDGVWQPGVKLLPDDFDPNYHNNVYFGQSVSLAGDELLVGARLGTSDGQPSQSGAAYLFRYDPALAIWSQEHKFNAPHGHGQFGHSVALEGGRALIGAPFALVDFNAWQGRSYLYERQPDDGWMLAQELVANDGTAQAQYGFAVAMQGDTLAIGSVRDRQYRGAGYMYQWAASHTVTPLVPGGDGSISPDIPQVLMAGTSTSFHLTPAVGHLIASVGGSCGGQLAGSVFTTNPITADCTVAADFAPQMLAVTASVASGSGSLTPSGTVSVAYGDDLTFELHPASSHVVLAVDGSCGGLLSGTSFTTEPVVMDCTVHAHFGPDPGDIIFADGFETGQ